MFWARIFQNIFLCLQLSKNIFKNIFAKKYFKIFFLFSAKNGFFAEKNFRPILWPEVGPPTTGGKKSERAACRSSFSPREGGPPPARQGEKMKKRAACRSTFFLARQGGRPPCQTAATPGGATTDGHGGTRWVWTRHRHHTRSAPFGYTVVSGVWAVPLSCELLSDEEVQRLSATFVLDLPRGERHGLPRVPTRALRQDLHATPHRGPFSRGVSPRFMAASSGQAL